MSGTKEKILYHMKQKGWSIVTTSERSGVKVSTIKSILYNKSNSQRISTLENLAKAFGCSVADLASNEEPLISNSTKVSKKDDQLFQISMDAILSYLKKNSITLDKDLIMKATDNLFSLLLKRRNHENKEPVDDAIVEWIIENIQN